MTESKQPVTIGDIDIPFWRIVVILIKWTIAAIPAAFVIFILFTVLIFIVGGFIVGLAELVGLNSTDIPFGLPVTPPGQ